MSCVILFLCIFVFGIRNLKCDVGLLLFLCSLIFMLELCSSNFKILKHSSLFPSQPHGDEIPALVCMSYLWSSYICLV